MADNAEDASLPGEPTARENGAPPDEPRSVLLVNALGPFGESVCARFARKGTRITIQYDSDEGLERAVRMAATAAEKGGAALPLRAEIGGGPEAAELLVERVVGDFGRLDTVVFLATAKESEESPAPGETTGPVSEEIARWCARAAAPHLRRSRNPAGHFIVVVSNVPSKEKKRGEEAAAPSSGAQARWQALADDLAAECSKRSARTCANVVIAATGLPDPVARVVTHLAAQRRTTGQVFHVDSTTHTPPPPTATSGAEDA